MTRTLTLCLLGTPGLLLANLPAHAHHTSVGFGATTAGPIMTIPADTLEQGKWAFGISVDHVKSKGYRDAELIDFAARHVHAHSSDHLTTAALVTSYGVTDDLSVGVRLPYAWRANIRAGHHSHSGGGVQNTAEDHGDVEGLGDASLLGEYRFFHDERSTVRWALLAGVKLPTGGTDEHTIEGERFETEHQPGSGSWDPLLGLAYSRDVGRGGVSASVLYQFATEGAQDTDLGDLVQYGVAYSHRLGAVSEDEPRTAWDAIIELHGEWQDKQEIAGEQQADTGGNSLHLAPGLRYTSFGKDSRAWSAGLSVGVPVAQNPGASHPETDYVVTATFGLSL